MSFQQVSTATYSVIPPTWRKIADSQIADLKQTFTQCCHEINIKSLTPETPYSNFFNISKQKNSSLIFRSKNVEMLYGVTLSF